MIYIIAAALGGTLPVWIVSWLIEVDLAEGTAGRKERIYTSVGLAAVLAIIVCLLGRNLHLALACPISAAIVLVLRLRRSSPDPKESVEDDKDQTR